MRLFSQIPNLLSVLRVLSIPSLLFCSIAWRFPILIAAALTDFFDGYLARKWNVTSKFGTIIDPIGDKGLAVAVAYLFWSEGLMSVSQLALFFSREWALLFFVIVAVFQGRWRQWTIQSFWCGKIATSLQAIIAGFFCYGISPPTLLYSVLLLSGVGAFFELIYRMKKSCTISISG